MKDKQKIYIRGNKERGDEIRNILTGLGAHAVTDISCNYDRFIYFINHDNEISVALVGSEVARIIMGNYREIKLPEQTWKDGDVLVNVKRDRELYAVFDRDVPYLSFNAYLLVGDGCIEAVPYDEAICIREDYRLATPSEIEHFHELLHKHGKDWDAEKKRLVDWRWKPKDMEEYWFFTGSNTIIRSVWKDTLLDNKYFDFGNCFQTKKEAEIAAERVKKTLKGE